MRLLSPSMLAVNRRSLPSTFAFCEGGRLFGLEQRQRQLATMSRRSFGGLHALTTAPRVRSLWCHGGALASSFPHQQVRTNYQVYLGKHYDAKQQKVVHDDWDQLVHEFVEPIKFRSSSASGGMNQSQTLLNRHLRSNREGHVKPTEQRRRIASRQQYTRSMRQVDSLLAYIQFQKSASSYNQHTQMTQAKARTDNPLGYTAISQIPITPTTSSSTTGYRNRTKSDADRKPSK
jgi:hypothetical protein